MVAELGTRAFHSLLRALSPPFHFTNSELHNHEVPECQC